MKLSDRRVQAKIVSQRPDGRGGIVRIPVARVSNVDLSKTAGEGSGSMNVSQEIFDEIAANFATKPGPVGLYDQHKKNRKGNEPLLGAVLDAWVTDDLLWNEIDLGGAAWKLLVDDRGVIGASIEAEQDPEFPTAKLKGWAQTGVIATNNPALDVQFYFESANSKSFTGYPVMFSFGDDPSKEPDMKTVTLETLEADKLALEGKLVQLETDKKKSDDKVVELQAKVAELEKRPPVEKLIALDAQILDLQNRDKAREVKSIHASAVAAGKPPAFFEGCEADPMKFLNDRFKGDLAAFQLSVNALPVVAKLGAGQGPGSGSGGTPVGSAKQKLIAEARKIEAAEKIGFSDAIYRVRDSGPEGLKLFQDATTEYAATEVPLA